MASKSAKSDIIPAELPILHGPGFDWDLAQVDEAQVQGLYARGASKRPGHHSGHRGVGARMTARPCRASPARRRIGTPTPPG
ncbi:MAG: hypothetical protein M1415_00200 [Firmicutes bacterium]|nr:hypothetical protein [Bacillota bacterium]MCL5065531.1 hypothetical protein [Bacillota bacterium]